MSVLGSSKAKTIASMFVGAFVLVGIGALVFAGGSDQPPQVANARPTATFEVGLDIAPTARAENTVQPEPTVLPTVPPEPNRADCNAIRGTSYQSDTEAAWFRASCTGSGGTGGTGTAVSNGPRTGDRLTIPSIGLSATITSSRVGTNGVMPTPPGYYDVFGYDFAAYGASLGGTPEKGNVVLAGHVTCAFCNNGARGRVVFGSVPDLRAGAEIQYRTSAGQTFSYVVTGHMDVFPESGDWNSILSAGRADMTLITCNGVLDLEHLEYDQRRVVFAKKV